ncbi:zinc ribbon domain-containing protein, partial [Bacillus thuringiensis]
KAIAKQWLYELQRQIQYKSEKYGMECMEADKWYPSSTMCSSCGSVKKDLKLSHCIYKCACSHVID